MTVYRRFELPAHVASPEATAALKAAIDVMLTSYSHTTREVFNVLSEASQRSDIGPDAREALGLLSTAILDMIGPLERQEQWAKWADPRLHNDVESIDYAAIERWISEGGQRPF